MLRKQPTSTSKVCVCVFAHYITHARSQSTTRSVPVYTTVMCLSDVRCCTDFPVVTCFKDAEKWIDGIDKLTVCVTVCTEH